MKILIDILSGIFKYSKKNVTITISIVVISIWITMNAMFYKTQVEKIPAMEQKVIEHDKICQIIPQMADDIRWLTRNRRGR